MGKKSKAPKIDTAPAMAHMEKYTPTSYNSKFGGLGAVSSKYDTATKSMTGELQGSEATNRLSDTALKSLQGMDEAVKLAGQEAYDVNYAPAQRQTSNTLNDLMMQGGGNNIRGNSRMQDIMARNADQLSESQGQRLYAVRNQGENDALTKLLQKYNMRMNPLQMLMGQQGQLTNQLGSGITGMGQQGANILNNAAVSNAQMKQQAQQSGMSGIGSAIGGGMALAGSMFSDENLKENIEEVGQLNNGLNIYTYNYKGDDTPRIGLLAQEVQKVKPAAVHKDPMGSGFLKVDYRKAVVA